MGRDQLVGNILKDAQENAFKDSMASSRGTFQTRRERSSLAMGQQFCHLYHRRRSSFIRFASVAYFGSGPFDALGIGSSQRLFHQRISRHFFRARQNHSGSQRRWRLSKRNGYSTRENGPG